MRWIWAILFPFSLTYQTSADQPGEWWWFTNPPAVFRVPAKSERPRLANRLPENAVFDHFFPDSLNNEVWTNLIAHTNGLTMQIWSIRSHPAGWPKRPPTAIWNTNSLIWGMHGMTAISPCWEDEGAPGQVPITALTRRHGYTRGHDMGADGFATRRKGKKVWFVTADNQTVEVKVKREVVRTREGPTKEDYTILLFDRDLPASIEPPQVIAPTNSVRRYFLVQGAPWPFMETEQTGNVSADLPGLTVNTWKGGDSGSPNFLPMHNQLVFVAGRSTSGASAQMQSDMDTLCRQDHLDPNKYQLQWVDISKYPAFQY